MANILDGTKITNPLLAQFYAVQGGLDCYIDSEDLLDLQYNNKALKFDSVALTSAGTAQTIDFTARSGQTAFADATYMIMPFAFDGDGVNTPVKIVPSSKVAGGFQVVNESGVALTFNYICFKL